MPMLVDARFWPDATMAPGAQGMDITIVYMYEHTHLSPEPRIGEDGASLAAHICIFETEGVEVLSEQRTTEYDVKHNPVRIEQTPPKHHPSTNLIL
jgi:hypothetical protein